MGADVLPAAYLSTLNSGFPEKMFSILMNAVSVKSFSTVMIANPGFFPSRGREQLPGFIKVTGPSVVSSAMWVCP